MLQDFMERPWDLDVGQGAIPDAILDKVIQDAKEKIEEELDDNSSEEKEEWSGKMDVPERPGRWPQTQLTLKLSTSMCQQLH